MNTLCIIMKFLKGNRNQVSEEGLDGEKPSKEQGLGQSKVRAASSLVSSHSSSLRFLWLFVLREGKGSSCLKEVTWCAERGSCLTTYALGQVNSFR